VTVPALALVPLGAALLVLASRATGPRRLPAGIQLALAGVGVHVAVGGAYGVLTLPFSGSVAFASASAAAMMAAGALVVWVSHARLDDGDDGGDHGPGGPDHDDHPPFPPFDWDSLEREFWEHAERAPKLVVS
jgi:hypothetical protein